MTRRDLAGRLPDYLPTPIHFHYQGAILQRSMFTGHVDTSGRNACPARTRSLQVSRRQPVQNAECPLATPSELSASNGERMWTGSMRGVPTKSVKIALSRPGDRKLSRSRGHPTRCSTCYWRRYGCYGFHIPMAMPDHKRTN